MDTQTNKQNPEVRPPTPDAPETSAAQPSQELEPSRELPSTENEVRQSSPVAPAAAHAPEPGAVPAGVPATAKTDLDKEIEDILSEDLDNLFWGLTADQQAIFKEKGEEAASRIRWLLSEAQVKIQDILKLIAEWLKTLPGVNSIFVEQEAKNKTDKILKLRG